MSNAIRPVARPDGLLADAICEGTTMHGLTASSDEDHDSAGPGSPPTPPGRASVPNGRGLTSRDG